MASSPFLKIAGSLARLAVREGPRIVREVQRRRAAAESPRPAPRTTREPARQQPGSEPARKPARQRSRPPAASAPGVRLLTYTPDLDGRADPGEVVWTWVAYEEDPTRGKDRPVLVVGRDGDALLGLMLSSQQERAGQAGWFELGSGPWDRDGRPSWLRLDRVLEMTEDGIRREGAVLERDRFDRVAAVLRSEHGWSSTG